MKNELSCLFQAPIIDERTHRLVSRVTHRNILGFLVQGLAICNVTFWEFVLAWVTGHASLMYPIRGMALLANTVWQRRMREAW